MGRRTGRKARTAAAIAGLAALVVSGCSNVGDERAGGAGPDSGAPLLDGIRLISFNACDELESWFKTEALERVGPYGLDGGYATKGGIAMEDVARGVAAGSFAGAPTTMAPAVPSMAQGVTSDAADGRETDTDSAPPGASVTNTVEVGVDEPDVVKTDGRRIVTLSQGRLYILDPGAGTPTVLGTLDLPTDVTADSLLLAGDRVLVLGTTWGASALARPIAPGEPNGSSSLVVLRQVDISDPAAPRVTSTLQVDGSLVDSRATGDVARIVVTSPPAGIDFLYPSGPGAEAAATAANRAVIEGSTLDQWLPGYRLDAGGQESTGRTVACDQVHRPTDFAGFSMLSVLTVDLAADLTPGAGTGLLAEGQQVYASAENLYVALNETTFDEAMATTAESTVDPVAPVDPVTNTVIHQFATPGAGPATYVGSGEVQGHLLNDFSMSEHAGVLRVATTEEAWGGTADQATSESFVTTLALGGDQLSQVGQVGGLGAGERIQAVRFLGDVGYVVTFRQTDPLYTIDLSDPASPAVVGELKILGYSAYLHPLGDGLLLGVGVDASEEGRRTGSQVSLFDVSDAASPQLLSQVTLPGGWSDVEQDHHAFLWWAATNLAVVPVSSVGGRLADGTIEDAFAGALAMGVDGGTLVERARIQHAAVSTMCAPYPSPAPVPAPVEDQSEGASPDAVTEPTGVIVAPYPGCVPQAPGIIRSLVIGDALYTLSYNSLQANALSDFATLGSLTLS